MIKKIFFYLFLGLIPVFMVGCGETVSQTGTVVPQSQVGKGSIYFSVSPKANLQTTGGRYFAQQAQTIPTPSAVYVTITNIKNEIVYHQKLPLSSVNGTLQTDKIPLTVGTYQVSEFYLVDTANNTVYAAPLKDSNKAYLVKAPLPVSFLVCTDNVQALTIEVVSSVSQNMAEFGYSLLDYRIVHTFSFLLSSSLLTGESVSTNLTITTTDQTIYQKALTPYMNVIEIRDGAELYCLTASVNGYVPVTKKLYAADLKTYSNLPIQFNFLFAQNKCAVGFKSSDLTLYANLPDPLFWNFEFPFKAADGFSSIDYYLRTLKARNAVPVLSWGLSDGAGQSVVSDILNHTYDAYLDTWADYLKTYQAAVIIRPGYEMNGDWTSWGQNASQYQQAFRYIVDKFRARGASNVYWMFSIANSTSAGRSAFTDYFPGTDYVDCVGVSGYNFGTTQTWSTWSSFWDLHHASVVALTQAYHLPILIETGCVPEGGDKAAWITDMMGLISTHADFANVYGFLWNNQPFTLNGVTVNVQVYNSEASAFSSGVASGYFIKN